MPMTESNFLLPGPEEHATGSSLPIHKLDVPLHPTVCGWEHHSSVRKSFSILCFPSLFRHFEEDIWFELLVYTGLGNLMLALHGYLGGAVHFRLVCQALGVKLTSFFKTIPFILQKKCRPLYAKHYTYWGFIHFWGRTLILKTYSVKHIYIYFFFFWVAIS